MPIAHVNGTDIFYVTQGNPSHPAIVFSNSLGTDHSMWQAQADALSKAFHVIRYDTRGHGKSASPAGPYQLEQLGRDVIALLDFYTSIKLISAVCLWVASLVNGWGSTLAPASIVWCWQTQQPKSVTVKPGSVAPQRCVRMVCKVLPIQPPHAGSALHS
jgi:3-oxoadipate enol-lactonase